MTGASRGIGRAIARELARTHRVIGTYRSRADAAASLKSETGEVLQGTETDSLGPFTFQQVPPGVYDLTFDLESQEVFISSLELMND